VVITTTILNIIHLTILHKNDRVGHSFNNYYLSIVCGKGNKRMMMKTKKNIKVRNNPLVMC